ncbi:hypothetical protein D8B29_06240, partial [Verminephrobacter eiseniae]|nr:hypothetical protein [Verminephrobacter eiseniae]
SKRIAALHRLPIRSVWAARCALRCAPMAARSLRHLIGDATLAFCTRYCSACSACSAPVHRPSVWRSATAEPLAAGWLRPSGGRRRPGGPARHHRRRASTASRASGASSGPHCAGVRWRAPSGCALPTASRAMQRVSCSGAARCWFLRPS